MDAVFLLWYKASFINNDGRHLMNPFRVVDDFLIDRIFQPASDWFHAWTGWSKFMFTAIFYLLGAIFNCLLQADVTMEINTFAPIMIFPMVLLMVQQALGWAGQWAKAEIRFQKTGELPLQSETRFIKF